MCALKNLLFLCLCVYSRLRLASFDSSGKLMCSRTTGYQILTLEKDQVCLITFLLIFYCSICLLTPF